MRHSPKQERARRDPQERARRDPQTRARGMPGARCTRGLACSVENTRVSHHRFTGTSRHSLRDGFNGLYCALPGDEFVLSPSPANGAASDPGRDQRASAGLTPATGARTTRLCRPHQCRRLARCNRSQAKDPPCVSPCAPAPPRPPHPAPTFVTMANAPLSGAGRRGR
jgi:hypothetical protein